MINMSSTQDILYRKGQSNMQIGIIFRSEQNVIGVAHLVKWKNKN